MKEVRCYVCLGLFLPEDPVLVHTCDGCDEVVVVHDGLCDTLLHGWYGEERIAG